MPGRPSGRPSRLGAVLVLAVLPFAVTGPAGAADDPPVSTALVSGVEAAKAALVRIEVSATAEIAHIDHSTGEVDVVRGRYEVPIRSGTGVFTSADGVIATAGSTLVVAEDQVRVHAANQLFQEEMGTALVGDDGDLSRRAQAVDRYLAPRLQSCYDGGEDCVLLAVPKYQVFPYTGESTSAPADVLRPPDGPTDVGLLRIGGGGTPTAELAPPGQEVPEQALLTGFTQRPDPALPPGELAVAVDAATAALSAEGDVAGELGAGMAGGPVLDVVTGQVAGLAAVVDGQAVLVAAPRVHEVLEAAGTPPAGSRFDAVFRRGLDQLAGGRASPAAASDFQESLTYYDSALAATHLEAFRTAGETTVGTAAEGGDPPGARGPWVVVAGVVALLALLALLGLVLLVRRRRTSGGSPGGVPPVPVGPPGGVPWTTASAGIPAARARPVDRPSWSREPTRHKHRRP